MHGRPLLTVVLVFICASAQAGPTIEPLLDSEKVSGCGCNFQLSGPNGAGKTFLSWLYEEDAYMRVDGKIERLSVKLIGEKVRKAGTISVGDSASYSFENRAVRAKAFSTVTQICSPTNIECESVGYRSRVVVTSSKGQTTLQATGACGC